MVYEGEDVEVVVVGHWRECVARRGKAGRGALEGAVGPTGRDGFSEGAPSGNFQIPLRRKG